MSHVLPVINAIAAVTTVAGVVGQANAQNKAAAAQERQQQLQVQMQRRQAIRQAQLQRAQTLTSGYAAGASGSSALGGGVSSLGSQLGSQFGYSSQMSGISGNINMFNAQGARFGALATLGGNIFSATGGMEQLGSTIGSFWNRDNQQG